jgi:hypothetical protein
MRNRSTEYMKKRKKMFSSSELPLLRAIGSGQLCPAPVGRWPAGRKWNAMHNNKPGMPGQALQRRARMLARVEAGQGPAVLATGNRGGNTQAGNPSDQTAPLPLALYQRGS